MAKTKDALKILDRITGNDEDLKRLIDEEELNAPQTSTAVSLPESFWKMTRSG